jgi:hypothetical protein
VFLTLRRANYSIARQKTLGKTLSNIESSVAGQKVTNGRNLVESAQKITFFAPVG